MEDPKIIQMDFKQMELRTYAQITHRPVWYTRLKYWIFKKVCYFPLWKKWTKKWLFKKIYGG